MNLLAISNFFAELFADSGLYLCLLAAMGAAAVLFIIIALLVPRKAVKRDDEVKKDSRQEKQVEEQTEQTVEVQSDETVKFVYDDEQVPTVKQVLGEAADEFDDDEPVIETEPLSVGSGRTEPVLSFEQIINEVKEKTNDESQKRSRNKDKPKVK